MLDEWYTQSADLTATQLWVALAINVAVLTLFLVAYVSIIRKAGYSGWWVLLGLVPVVNVVMFFTFAFREWPVTRDLRSAQLAASVATAASQGPRFTWR